MIYFGIHIEQESVEIVALSKQFAVLGKQTMSHDLREINQWADQFAINDHEKRQWYFDSLQFQPHFIRFRLWGQSKSNRFYLVDHRKLNEIVKVFYDYSLVELNHARHNGIAFFLASARRLLPAQFIQKVDPEEYLPF